MDLYGIYPASPFTRIEKLVWSKIKMSQIEKEA